MSKYTPKKWVNFHVFKEKIIISSLDRVSDSFLNKICTRKEKFCIFNFYLDLWKQNFIPLNEYLMETYKLIFKIF